MYNIAEMSEFDVVDVVTLGFRGYDREDLSLLCGFRIHDITRVTNQLVITVLGNLWKQLPYHEQDRCHNPPYGLRFYHGDTKIMDASICWECNNIWIELPDTKAGSNFDGRSESAQKLLHLLRYLSGNYLREDRPQGFFADYY